MKSKHPFTLQIYFLMCNFPSQQLGPPPKLDHNLFNHSPINRHSGFQFFAITSRVAIDIKHRILV